MSCCVPCCTSTSGRSQRYPDGVTKHRFPKKNPKRLEWIRAIPRDNWEPPLNAVVCSLHFDESDFSQDRSDSNPYRKLKEGKLRRRQLKENAVPRFFPGLPKYFSTPKAGST